MHFHNTLRYLLLVQPLRWSCVLLPTENQRSGGALAER